MGRVAERLAQLSVTLPDVAAPVGAYVPALRDGDHVLTSGQLPFVGGELPVTGLVGAEVSAEEAADLARTCTINALAAVASVLEGDLDRVVQVVKVVGFVASAPGFGGQPGVLNGASRLLGEVFGDAGVHARSAVGVAALPLGASVEVELTVRVRD
ncbi:RidA family protein [Janibacter alkaliphilus]|uniref:Enamine deaminase RidA (YjgF/YER057c/UK114 family) n=1 Tax=Janibacter alkaliphilus TaxID=1069963 RepID=A0A852WZI3_9MICO|nr:RidA family protein [Janibacter alkaliphilus]NYG36019.1 enamine deaminase RidA (YjgF/YER057c/UK114 family) [Janibacter alkaliphilus]